MPQPHWGIGAFGSSMNAAWLVSATGPNRLPTLASCLETPHKHSTGAFSHAAQIRILILITNHHDHHHHYRHPQQHLSQRAKGPRSSPAEAAVASGSGAAVGATSLGRSRSSEPLLSRCRAGYLLAFLGVSGTLNSRILLIRTPK